MIHTLRFRRPFSRSLSALLVVLCSGDVRATSYAQISPTKAKAPGAGPLVRIQRHGKWGYINRAGRVVISPRFDDAGDFFDGLANVQLNGKWGYIRDSGMFAIPPQFDEQSYFHEERAPVWLNDRMGVIDTKGQFVTPPRLDWANRFSQGLAAACVSAKRKEAPGVTWQYGGRWGFIDRAGRWVVGPQFDQVEDFSEGLAAVRIGATIGRDA